LFDLQPLVTKLRTEYAGTAAMTDSARQPSFAELYSGISELGKILTVRQDGLTLRGRKGRWPLVTSAGFPAAIERLIHVSARNV
jgi:hypothetical protein